MQRPLTKPQLVIVATNHKWPVCDVQDLHVRTLYASGLKI
jgi:hypothetical protein